MSVDEFEAIIFDCDGVLVDSEILGLDASESYLREHGFSWTQEDFRITSYNVCYTKLLRIYSNYILFFDRTVM